MTTNIFDEAEKEIKNLISLEHYSEAHQLCERILQADPDNSRFYGFKNKITQLVRKKNRLLIEQDLKKVEPLWQQQRYSELLEHFKQITAFIDDYPELKELIVKAQHGYDSQQLTENQNTYEKLYQAAETLINQNQFNEAQKALQQLTDLQINQKNTEKLKNKLKKAWIENQFANHQTLLKSTKYDDIIQFFHELLIIDPDSRKIKKMLKAAKKARTRFQIFERQDFIYKSLEQIRILYQLHKYKLTMQASREILDIDPKNAIAKSFYRLAKKKDEAITNQLVITQMRQTQTQLKAANQNKQTFAQTSF